MQREWLEAHKDYPHDDWCLIWPFARDKFTGRAAGSDGWGHRLMCELVHGPAPADKPQAAHSCGNGHEGCVNPRHLSWASNGENQRQRYAQGRINPNPTGNKSMFTAGQIAEMQALYGRMTQWEIATKFGCSLGTVQYYLKYRERRGHHTNKIDHWSPQQEQTLREATARGCYLPELVKLVGRSAGSITSFANRNGISIPRRPWGYTASLSSNGE